MFKKKNEDTQKEENTNKTVYDFESDSNDFFNNLENVQNGQLDEDSEEYEEELDEENPKSRKKITKVIILCIILSITFLLIWTFNSPTFIINEVNVLGNELKSYEDVYNKVQFVSGENIFLVDFTKLKNDISKISYIKDVKIRKIIPNKVEVSFSERTPYVMVKKDNEFIILDQDGYVIEIDLVDNVYDIPLVSGLITDYELSGDQISSIDAQKLKNIVFLIKSLDNVNFEYKINDINYSTIDGISFKVDGTNLSVKFGDLDKNEVNDKLVYLNQIIKKSIEQDLSGTIDVTSDKYYEKSVLINSF